MEREPKSAEPDRRLTDESLRAERRNSDDAIAERLTEREDAADALLEHARERADAVLENAREKADREEPAATSGVRREVLSDERAAADRVLQADRVAADDALRREREAQARILAALLPLEREKTDRHLLIERARSDEAVAHRDDFMGMVSHDLRNLLSTILVDATVLAQQASATAEGERTAAGMKRLQRHVAAMNRLIGDLLDVVSIDAGKLAVHVERCDAAALLVEAADAFASSAAEKGIALEVDVPPGGVVAELDHARMLQVLGNLVSNALKFTPRGGRVVLRVCRRDGEVEVEVSDTGIGIPSSMLEAVFERFWQVGKDDRRGVGLGLYISRCLVEAHGGRMWAESASGEGTRIRVTIPEPLAPAPSP